MIRLSPLSVLLAIIAAVILMVAVAIGPAMKAASLDGRIADQERRVAEKRVLLQKRLRGSDAGPDLGNETLQSKQLLGGATVGVAGANLQKMLSDLLGRQGGTVASIQVLPAKDEGELAAISVRLTMRVRIEGLRAIVHHLETGQPLIFIDGISMRVENKETQAADPYLRSPLEVTMQVSGYVRKQGTPEL